MQLVENNKDKLMKQFGCGSFHKNEIVTINQGKFEN